jgi:hypothetical protein
MDFSPYYYPNGRSRKQREAAKAPIPTGLLFKFRDMNVAEEFAAKVRVYARVRVYTNAAQEPFVAADRLKRPSIKFDSIKFIKDIAVKMGASLIGR